MKSMSNLLTVVMDGIRDSNMLYDYAEQAEVESNIQLRDWFRKKADERAQRTMSEWTDAKTVMKLDEKTDDMSACLRNHVEHEMLLLKAHMTK